MKKDLGQKYYAGIATKTSSLLKNLKQKKKHGEILKKNMWILMGINLHFSCLIHINELWAKLGGKP